MPTMEFDFTWLPQEKIKGTSAKWTRPRYPQGPTVYRVTFKRGGKIHTYVGESEFGFGSRRDSHLRNTTNPPQMAMRQALDDFGALDVAILSNVSTINVDGRSRPVNLDDYEERKVVEAAVWLAAKVSGEIVMNNPIKKKRGNSKQPGAASAAA